MKCIEARAVLWPDVSKFYGSRTLYIVLPAGGANDVQNVSVEDPAKDNDQQNLF